MPVDRRHWLGLVAATPLALHAGPTTDARHGRLVVLVRHAEKADDDPRDPTLSEAGQARANALASLLGELPVDQMLVTPLRRTSLTAAPLAKARQLEPTAIGFGETLDEHIQATRDAVASGSGISVIVGHSNTVPLLVAALGGPADLLIDDDRYQDLFLLLGVSSAATPWLLRASYGCG